LVALVFCVGLSASIASAGEPEEFHEERSLCAARIEKLDHAIRSSTLWGNVLLICGAASAAIGSALAGFLKNEKARKSAAIIGAVGAVVSVIQTKVVPEKDVLQAQLLAADRHRSVAEKVRGQLPYLDGPSFIRENKKYVVARFLECAALEAKETVPEFPQPNDTAVAVQPSAVAPAAEASVAAVRGGAGPGPAVPPAVSAAPEARVAAVRGGPGPAAQPSAPVAPAATPPSRPQQPKPALGF
jgi:hypothetical protein